MRLDIISGPASYPISLTEAKDYIKLDTSADDTYTTSAIKSATELIEQFLGRKLISQEIRMTDYILKSYIDLPFDPLISITHVKTVDEYGVKTTLTLTTDYVIDYGFEPLRLRLGSGYPINYEVQAVYGYGTYTPPTIDGTTMAALITATGLTSAQILAALSSCTPTIPYVIIDAIKMMTAEVYENRNRSIPDVVKNILNPFRIRSL